MRLPEGVSRSLPRVPVTGTAPTRERDYPGRGLHGSVVEALGRRIAGGAVLPGATLPVESALADEADVSRTVVREAMRVLASKGLVEARPMRGTVVRPRRSWRLLDPDVLRWSLEGDGQAMLLRDLLDVRAMIEPPAARLAALRADDATRRDVEAALALVVDSVAEPEAFIDADLALHSAILSATGNLLVEEFVSAIGAALRLGRAMQARAVAGRRPDPRAALAPHAAVVSAIVAGDGARAEAAMSAIIAGAARDAERATGLRQATTRTRP